MDVIMERFPYRYVESGIIELNGKPDYRIQKFNEYTRRYNDMYLCAVSYTHLTLPTNREV